MSIDADCRYDATVSTERARYTLKADPHSSHSVMLRWLGDGRDRRLLDVGAADGLLSRELSARGWRVTGIEADAERAKAGAGTCETMLVADLDREAAARVLPRLLGYQFVALARQA